MHSFGRIWIRISDLWCSFQANPFSDQWSIESTLNKASSDHSSEWSDNRSSDQSGTFLWVMDPKLLCPAVLALNYICTSYMRCTSQTFPCSVDSICVVVSGHNSNLFLPIIEWNSENWRSASKIQTFKWLIQNLSVLSWNCHITPVNTHACNLHDGTSCFVTALLEILLLGINLFVCYSDLLLFCHVLMLFAFVDSCLAIFVFNNFLLARYTCPYYWTFVYW